MYRNRLPLLLAALALSSADALAQQWELVWSDEFDYDGLPDDAKWNYDIGGHGWGNQESQHYTSRREKNTRVEDDMLVIEAHKEDYGGNQYTSARLVTPGTAVDPGGRLELAAEALDHAADVSHVDFLQEEGVLGRDGEPRYEWAVDGVHEGCYAVGARVVDTRGRPVASERTDVKVGSSCGQAPYLIAPHHIPGTVELEWYDLGGEGAAYHDTGPNNEGNGIRRGEGVDIQITSDTGGGHNVGWIDNGEWLAFTVNVDRTGIYRVEARVGGAQSTGAFSLNVGGRDRTGRVSIPSTGGW